MQGIDVLDLAAQLSVPTLIAALPRRHARAVRRRLQAGRRDPGRALRAAREQEPRAPCRTSRPGRCSRPNSPRFLGQDRPAQPRAVREAGLTPAEAAILRPRRGRARQPLDRRAPWQEREDRPQPAVGDLQQAWRAQPLAGDRHVRCRAWRTAPDSHVCDETAIRDICPRLTSHFLCRAGRPPHARRPLCGLNLAAERSPLGTRRRLRHDTDRRNQAE